MPRERKLTLRERADAWVNKNARFGGEDDANQGYLAGWHARGRAERVTKAERAVVEAAVAVDTTPSLAAHERLRKALDNLERAKAKGGK